MPKHNSQNHERVLITQTQSFINLVERLEARDNAQIAPTQEFLNLLEQLEAVANDKSYLTCSIAQIKTKYGITIDAKLKREWNKFVRQNRSLERKNRKANRKQAQKNEQEIRKNRKTLRQNQQASAQTNKPSQPQEYSNDFSGETKYGKSVHGFKIVRFKGELFPSHFVFLLLDYDVLANGQVIGYVRGTNQTLFWINGSVVAKFKDF